MSVCVCSIRSFSNRAQCVILNNCLINKWACVKLFSLNAVYGLSGKEEMLMEVVVVEWAVFHKKLYTQFIIYFLVLSKKLLLKTYQNSDEWEEKKGTQKEITRESVYWNWLLNSAAAAECVVEWKLISLFIIPVARMICLNGILSKQ